MPIIFQEPIKNICNLKMADLNIIPKRQGPLLEIYQEAKEDKIPIIRGDTEGLLKLLIRTIKAKRILEAGTAIGYSSILMASISGPETKIDTVEICPDTVERARQNIEKAGLSHKIHVILGDMKDVFSCLDKEYDLIFLDGAKSRYIDVYDDVLRLLRVGGLLVCDNILYNGRVFKDPKDCKRVHRTIVANLRAFLGRLTADETFETSILETGDGISISYRIK